MVEVAELSGLAFENIDCGAKGKRVHTHFIAILTKKSQELHGVQIGFVSIY